MSRSLSINYFSPVMRVADGMFAWFLPKWRKVGIHAYKSVTRYIHYRRDLLPEDKLEELAILKRELRVALDHWDKEEATRLSQLVGAQLDAIPAARPNEIFDYIESLFVILVIFLGLRTYVVQPFRIPTGSMQPSLNGIRILPVEQIPSVPERAWDWVTLGSSYVDEVANAHMTVSSYSQETKFLLFTQTVVAFNNGTRISIPSAEGEVRRYFQQTKGSSYPSFQPGETIIKASVDAGDLVLVDKVSYHFRNPQRGETFVFDTRGIVGIAQRSGDQAQGTHYIKRLSGVPGDKLEILPPHLMVNGQEPTEWTMKRISQGLAPYHPAGYTLPSPEPARGRIPQRQYLADGQSLTLANPKDKPLLREYVALGDNTNNSLDSRYWGPLHQYNIVGPAAFVLWPFTSHWGIIP